MNVREMVQTAKSNFKQQQRTPNLKYLEEKRRALENKALQLRQIETEKKQIKTLKKEIWEQEHPLATKIKEQIAQGGKKGLLEFQTRSEEFRRQNQLPGGVMGSNIPSLTEEQKVKEDELQRTNSNS